MNDYQTYSIISTFYLACRGRSYLSGMSVIPLPLSVLDITNTINAHPVLLERSVLDACVFALDDIYLSEASEKAETSQENKN
ncbi:hypothetical protein [Helicobacter pylori]|uniref:hypothetical protein n=1 Tax=Helicobacter pylori TaxID=210 RepID=UPI002AC6D5C0|nr:hypothetical protein [Helicobacter pylori]MDZ5288565.1 hypothetical protein [Helicobacter pylori]